MTKAVQYHIECQETKELLIEKVNGFLDVDSGWDVEGPITYINVNAQFASKYPIYEYHQVLVRRT